MKYFGVQRNFELNGINKTIWINAKMKNHVSLIKKYDVLLFIFKFYN